MQITYPNFANTFLNRSKLEIWIGAIGEPKCGLIPYSNRMASVKSIIFRGLYFTAMLRRVNCMRLESSEYEKQ